MSFWKNLFGGGGGADGGGAQQAPGEEYKGYTIRATPKPLGSEFQLAGRIEKEIGGETKAYDFVRADRMNSREDAVALGLSKARQIVDEQGDKMFSQSWPKTN